MKTSKIQADRVIRAEMKQLNENLDDDFLMPFQENVNLIPVDAGKVIVKKLDPHLVIGCVTPGCDELAEYVVFIVRDEVDDEGKYHHYISPCCKADKIRLETEAIIGDLVGSVLH